ncbi:rhodanese-like domain-containing protein [Oceanobacter mangrovi]|uniref:rhodanese-like domain-containing protein n=1 Tax=Oceanobacter mangrovi TaxID=2862510 RepID=UPI001C8EC6A1|nr:rhodanese-like domain-containing protein [Oceanobacter mangrovi]
MSQPIRMILCEDAGNLLEKPDLLLLDCRDVRDYQASHLDGALHAHDDLVTSLIRKRDLERPILIYCYAGHRSENLCELFVGFGFKQVYNLAGGYMRWQETQQVSGSHAAT